MKSVSGLDTQVGGRDTQWSTLLSDFLRAQVYKQPCKKHKSRSYQRERCDLPYAAVYRTIQRFTLMNNKSTCAQSDYISSMDLSSYKWPILCLESRHLIHFCRVFTIAKVDHFGTEFSSFRAKAKILKQNQISSNFLIVCTFFNRICGELIE